MSTKRMALLAVYTTIALTIFTIESMIPPLVPIHGVKLGLANVITLWLLMYFNWKDALLVLLMRILIASMVAGQMLSFTYSLSGGLLCLIVMGLLYQLLGKKAIIFVSIIGAIFHNIGQVLMALVVLQSQAPLAYLPILLISAIITGTFTGLCAHFASKHIPKNMILPK